MGDLRIYCLGCDCELAPDEVCGREEYPDDPMCGGCHYAYVLDDAKEEAEAYALEHCKLTAPPHEYDPSHHYAPSPDDYEMGMRGAYTENAVRAYNRHNRTNYDALIRDLERHDPEDQAYYLAIRDRCADLVDEAIASGNVEEEERDE